MTRPCTVCTHPSRADIDKALLAGETCPNIAERYSTISNKIGRMAVQRHKDHIPQTLAKAKEEKDASHADNLLRDARGLRSKAVSLLLQAEESGLGLGGQII